MADGSIRIKTRIDNSGAKRDAKEFEKVVDDAAENAKQSGEKASVNIDVTQAEKEIKRLEKEIQKYEAMIEELEAGKLGKYNAERAALNESTKADLLKASSPDQKANVRAMHESTLAQINSKYSDVLAKADKYGNIIAQNDAKIQQLKQSVEQVSASQRQVNSDTQKAQSATTQTASHASRLKGMFSGAKSAALGIARAMGGAALTGVKKVGSAVKSKLVNGLKNSVSHIKNIGKQADGLHKKFLKMGLSLIGIQGLLAGMRQIVSSALQNNETLQKQLTAIKGVLGQALLPVINFMTEALGQIVTFVDKLYQLLTGTSLVAKYNASQADKLAASTADAAKSAKEYKKQLASFDVASKFEDNSSSSSNNSSSGDTAIFETQELSGWAQDLLSKIKKSWQTADFTDVGKTISEKIVEQLQGISWEDIKSKAFGAGKSFATLINGLFEYSDEDGNTLATSLGGTIAESLNTAVSLVGGIAGNLEWGAAGENTAEGLLKFLSTFEWDKAGQTIHDFCVGLCEAIAGFFDRLTEGDEGYETMKKAVTDFFNGLKIEEIALSIVKAIVSITKFSIKYLGNLGVDLLKGFFSALGIEWDGEFIQLGGPFGISVPKISWKKQNKNDEEETKKTFSERIKEMVDKLPLTPFSASVGGSSGSKGINIPISAKFSQSVADIKNSWKERMDTVKDKTASFNAKFSQTVSNIKASWDERKAKITDKAANLSARFSQSASDIRNAWQSRVSRVQNKTYEITARFRDAVTSAINSLISRLNSVIYRLRNIRVANIRPFSGMNTIPYLAKGGIVNNPGKGVPAVIGEAGTEAVLPLERNTEWMDIMADKLAQKISGGGQPIVVYSVLDGKILGKSVAKYNAQQSFIKNGGTA